ncbi:guanine nucleotide exchange factor [Anaeramoeba flamelloides]|uniref:Guanine nucleotide exchange factor n=1 Tax=Anaeramoeba flamelloides TaxID=1746091 RepID=A0ABQ8XAV2_9EUKA|nr:guanine nucleotide exchange factor [Anaeramoeba flamelloides]
MNYQIDSRVSVFGLQGTVKFFGNPLFSDDKKWVGVELDEPFGRNNGTVNNQEYFQCKPNHGIFVRPSIISPLEPKEKTQQKKKKNNESLINRFLKSSQTDEIYRDSKDQQFKELFQDHLSVLPNMIQEIESYDKNIKVMEDTINQFNEIDADDFFNQFSEESDLDEEQLLMEIGLLDKKINSLDLNNTQVTENLQKLQNEIHEQQHLEQEKQLNLIRFEVENLQEECEKVKTKRKKIKDDILSLKMDIQVEQASIERNNKVWNNKIDQINENLIKDQKKKKQVIQKFIDQGYYPYGSVREMKLQVQQNKELNKYLRRRLFSLNNQESPIRIESKEVLMPNDNCDRGEWLSYIIRNFQDIKKLRERVIPEKRLLTFARLYGTSKIEIDKALTKDIIHQLLMTHFRFLKKHPIANQIQEIFEPKKILPFRKNFFMELLMGIYIGVQEFWDFTIVNKNKKQISFENLKMDIEQFGRKFGLEFNIKGDVYFWNDRKDTPNNIHYDQTLRFEKPYEPSGWLEHCSINKLIQLLLSEEIDEKFYSIFLNTYYTFINPKQLISKLTQAFFPPKKKHEKHNIYLTRKDKYRLRIFNFLKKWLSTEDVLDSQTLSDIKEFVDIYLQKTHPTHSELLFLKIKRRNSNLSNNNMNDQLRNKTQVQTFKKLPPQPKVPENIFSNSLKLIDISSVELARQITLSSAELFRQINPESLAILSWTKKRLRHKGETIHALIEQSNQIANWTLESVIVPLDAETRADNLTLLIELGDNLAELHNYHGVMAVINAIAGTTVKRLDETFELITTKMDKILENLEELTAEDNNFQAMKNACQETDVSVIPYLGIYLTELVYIDVMPTKIDGLINFKKCRQIYRVISFIQKIQLNCYYNFTPILQIQALLKNYKPTYTPDELYDLSKQREK